jgi:succinylglutamic semialdehyde dehydrogenase
MEMRLKGNYINGEWLEIKENSADGLIQRQCPAETDLILWKLPLSYSDVDRALEAAQMGFKIWKKTPLQERIDRLQAFKQAVAKRKDLIAEAIAWEMGKPLWEAKTEAAALMAKVDVTINDSLPRIQNKTYKNILGDADGHVFYKPLGPCSVIGPFNFPCHLANGQIVNALIAGNSIIFKPSEKTAYSGQLLIECFAEANFPKGVINLIQGDGEVARRLVKDKSIRGVFFTGSQEVGLKILKETYADVGKLVALELGGKNFSVLMDDINIQDTMLELIKACFLTTGQRCISTAIVPIHRKIAEPFIEQFHQLSKKIIVDHPVKYVQEPFMGPLVDNKALESYLLFMGMAKREGITEIMRGKQIERKYKGHYVSPSIHFCEKFTKDSHFLESEIFGPNVTFVPFDTLEEAIKISNSTAYGLAFSIFSNNKSNYDYCVENMDCGQVNWNRSTVGASSKLPFGGVKQSGNYRPAAVAMIDSCVYQMASLTRGPDNILDGANKEPIPGLPF